MRSLGLIRSAASEPPHDLWPRLRARLQDNDAVVRVHLPALGWRDAAAMAVAVGTLLVVPDPLGFLAACGLL